MRKVTQQITTAFVQGTRKASGNTHTDGSGLYLHGNKIAEKRQDGVYITNAGWFSNTTKERLNSIPGVQVWQKKGEWYLNGQKWGGDWIKVK